MKVILKAEAVDKSYRVKKNRNRVLKSVSLEIHKGEFLSVMGASGSGKSTLLYNISGMDRMDGGSVRFAGERLEDLSEKDLSRLRLHNMGFIFQQIHLLKNLSIRDNITVSALLARKLSRKDILSRAAELMEQTGIAEIGDNDITQASGGQLQRAAICRALVNDPEILFGDEPTGALNSGSAKAVMDILRTVNSQGKTVMLVTHDLRGAAGADRVLFMKDGRITAEYRNTFDHGDRKEGEHQLSRWLYRQGF